MKTNRRKQKLLEEKNVIVGRQNKILLQRIGNILTAAPKLTDEDYVKAKNLHPSLRKGNCLYEESIREQRLKKMKERIRNMHSMIKIKEFEDEYKSMKISQEKYMRQVKYRRPKDFVDPFLAEIQEDKNEIAQKTRSQTSQSMPNLRSVSPSSRNRAFSSQPSSAHINQIRKIKGAKSKKTKMLAKDGETDNMEPTGEDEQGDDDTESDNDDYFGYDDMDGREDLEDQHRKSSERRSPQSGKRLLAKNTRLMEVINICHAPTDGESSIDSNSVPGRSICMNVESTDLRSDHGVDLGDFITDIEVWLDGKHRLEVIANSKKGGDLVYEPRAHIELGNLDSINSHSVKDILTAETDSKLIELANEIIYAVEVRVEDGVSRLIIGLPLEFSTDTAEINNMLGFTQATEEEVERMLKESEPTVLIEGRAVPLHVSDSEKCDDSNKVTEKIFALLKIQGVGDEKVHITATFCTASTTMSASSREKKPLVQANSTLSLIVGLPSVMLADDELIAEFFNNIASSLLVIHNTSEQCNILSLKMM